MSIKRVGWPVLLAMLVAGVAGVWFGVYELNKQLEIQIARSSVYAGTTVVSDLEVRGSMLGYGDVQGNLTKVAFTLGTAGKKFDLGNMSVVFVGEASREEAGWSLVWMSSADGDQILDQGESALVTVRLPKHLGPNSRFSIEVGMKGNPTILLERSTPNSIDKVVDLH